MSNALQDVVSGALYNEARMGVLANNIGNISTQGFKEDRVSFELPDRDTTSRSTSLAVSNVIDPQEFYVGKPVQTHTNFASGQLKQTGNPLDVAIEGKGFFKIDTPEGIRYTRAGNFALNAEGLLTTPDGFPVLGEGGEITIDGDRVEVDMTGNIHVDGTSVGRLEVVDIPDTAGLIKIGGNLFAPAGEDIEEQAAEGVTIASGAVEQSNVDIVKSMTEMIEVLRGYETYQKMIQHLDETDGKIITEVGRIS